MARWKPFVRKDSYMPNNKMTPLVIGNGYTTDWGANGQPPVWDTAIGNPVSFNAITPFHLKQLSVAFSPVQDLHGYDSPWPAGGGKNLFPLPTAPMTSDGVTIEATEDGEIWVHGTPTIESGYIAFSLPSVSDSIVGKTATISINEKTVGVGVSTGATGGTLNLTMTETVTERTNVFTSIASSTAIFVRYDVGQINKKYKIQLEASESKTAFAPYSNLCPISGWSGVNVWQRGKNIADYPNMISAGAVEQEDGSLYVETARNYSGTKIFQNSGISGRMTITFTVKNDSASRGIYPRIQYTDGTSQNMPINYGYDTFTTFTTITAAGKDVDYIEFNYGIATVKTWFYIQVEIGITASDFVPYDPASQTIHVAFPAVGKNLFDKSKVKVGFYLKSTGAEEPVGIWNISDYIPVAVGDYVASSLSAGGSGTYCCVYDANKTFVRSVLNVANEGTHITVANGEAFVRLSVRNGSTEHEIDTAQFELGSSATAYEPYTTTAYSGTLDIVTGVLTVKHKSVDLGSLNWTYNSGALRFDCGNSAILGAKSLDGADVPNAYCTIYQGVKYNGNYGASGPNNVFFFDHALLRVRNKAYTDAATFKTAMSGVQLVYELAEPLTIQLTPQEVESLAGDNTMWSNANQPITVEYRSN